jgi:hypothetical protein
MSITAFEPIGRDVAVGTSPTQPFCDESFRLDRSVRSAARQQGFKNFSKNQHKFPDVIRPRVFSILRRTASHNPTSRPAIPSRHLARPAGLVNTGEASALGDVRRSDRSGVPNARRLVQGRAGVALRLRL